MRECGQRLWVYDEESLGFALRHAGFLKELRRKFGESAHPELRGGDCPTREFESLYADAVKK